MIYWTLKSVPELSPLPRKVRRRVRERCLRRHFWFARATTRSVAAYVASILMVCAIGFLGTTIPQVFGLADSIWYVLGSAMVGFQIAQFVFSRIAIPVLRPLYHEFI
jgi:hypothetical protein